jgi:hypothetical protein
MNVSPYGPKPDYPTISVDSPDNDFLRLDHVWDHRNRDGTLMTELPDLLRFLQKYGDPTEEQQERLAYWIEDTIAQKAPLQLLQQVRDFLAGRVDQDGNPIEQG